MHYNEYFQNAAKLALNQKEIRKYSERISKNKPFIHKYNWKGIDFRSTKDDR